VQHAARAIFVQVCGVLLAGIIELLRLLFGVQVVEVAEPFVEAVPGRQKLVAYAASSVALAKSGQTLKSIGMKPR